MRTLSDEICRENQNRRFYVQELCIENRAIYVLVEKCYTAGQAADVNKVHAHFMMGT